MIYPHEDNLDKKIADAPEGSEKRNDLLELKQRYSEYRRAMQAINYATKDIADYNVAATEMNSYLIEVDAVCERQGIKSQGKLRSTVLEELSVYMFERYPAVLEGNMEIFNKKIYAGIVVDSSLNYKILTKDVDFCIGKTASLSINGNTTSNVRFPFVCVECKTYLEATMNHDVLFSGTQIKTASPEAKTYVLMEYQDEISPNHPIPASYKYAIDKRFNLRDCKRPSGRGGYRSVTPIVGQHILDYYIEIESAL